MADPFAIIGLADTAFSLGCKVYEVFSAVKDAPLEIHSFVNELSTLNSVLQEVKDYIKTSRTSPLPAQEELNLELVGVALKQCNVELRDIYDAVSDQDAKQSLSIMKKLKSLSSWVIVSDERMKSTQRLSRARDTLSLAISTSFGRQLHYAREEIATVGRSQQVLISLLSAMQAAGQERVTSLSFRADEEQMRSETRLRDMSDKLHIESTSSSPSQILDRTEEPAAAIASEQPLQVTEGGSPSNTVFSEVNYEATVAHSTPSGLPHLEALDSALQDFKRHNTLEDKLAVPSSSASESRSSGLFKLVHTFENHGSTMGILPGSESANIVSGSVNLIHKAASKWHQAHEELLNMFEACSEAMLVCSREYELYPNAMIKPLLERLRFELVDFCTEALQMLLPLNSLRRKLLIQSQLTAFRKSVSRIQKISVSVRNEAEYQGRLELRQAHKRIGAMEVQQERIVVALEDQKKVLASLSEERRLVTMMKDQQSILQSLQQLQSRLM